MTGSGYKVGSLAKMGSGFMPVVLGVVLAFLGILIAGTALASSEAADKKFLPDDAVSSRNAALSFPCSMFLTS